MIKLHQLKEIESQERIVDPMEAVPNLPFGHLNTAWVRFRAELQPGDEIWSFSAPWEAWGRMEVKEGYVIVRSEDIGPYFITGRKPLEDG